MADGHAMSCGMGDELAARGHALVRQGDHEGALRISARLRELGDPAWFHVAARAHEVRGELEQAAAILRRGLAAQDDDWRHWKLLGDIATQLELFDEADEAYDRALERAGCWRDSVRLDQAILANRRGQHGVALALLNGLRQRHAEAHLQEHRLMTLAQTGQHEAALALATVLLDGGPGDDDESASRWARAAACAGRIRLEGGEPAASVRLFVLQCLARVPSSAMLLALLRDIEPTYSEAARCWRLFVRGTVSASTSVPRSAGAGFFVSYRVIAESPEQAMSFVEPVETCCHGNDLLLHAAEEVEPSPDQAMGVLWRSARTYFGRGLPVAAVGSTP